MIRDAHRTGVTLHADPLVILRVSKIVWIHLFGSFVERSFDRHRIHWLVADHHLYRSAGLRLPYGEIAEADVLVERGGRRAAGHPAGGRAVQKNFVAIAANASAPHLEAGQLPPDAIRLLRDQCIAPGELALVEFHNPVEARF